MTLDLRPFDPAEYLDTPEAAIGDALQIVSHCLLTQNIRARTRQLARDISGVGVDNLTQQKFGSNTKNFSAHFRKREY